MAYEIAERNFDESEIIIVGVIDNGMKLAELLEEEIGKIGQFEITLCSLELNKKTPLQSEIQLSISIDEFSSKTVLLVDDVLHTGRTLAYSLKPFLNCRIGKLQTAVLVDRDHKKFPVSADYVGYALSTTLKEHIEVELEDEQTFGVYLN